MAPGAGRAASSNSVVARSDKVVSVSGSWLSPFVVFLLGEVKKNKGVVEETGARGGCFGLRGAVAPMALPLLPSKARQRDLAGLGLGLGVVK